MVRLADVIGQAGAIRILRESLDAGRLHHALLFTGPRGVGKQTTARALAAELLCEAESAGACGTCPACTQVTAGTHPDLYREALEVDADRRRVSIDQIRRLQAALGRRPSRGPRSVSIVDDAERLTEEAQNAFLKTLEEPPAGAVVVLVSERATALLPTVRSRCQRIPFTPIPDADLETVLRERHGHDPEAARALASLSAGSLGTAVALKPDEARKALEEIRHAVDAVAAQGYEAVPQAAQVVLAREKMQPSGMEILLTELRRRLREAAGVVQDTELTPSGKTASLTATLQAVEAAVRAFTDLDRNAHRALALETMFLRIGKHLAGAR